MRTKLVNSLLASVAKMDTEKLRLVTDLCQILASSKTETPDAPLWSDLAQEYYRAAEKAQDLLKACKQAGVEVRR